MPHVVLVHGWNVADAGKNTVDRLAPHLETLDYTVDMDEADYGYLTWQMFSFVARTAMRPFIVRRLRDAFVDADVIVTHSNGANFAHRALKKMYPDDRHRTLIHFSPALNRKTRRPPGADEMHVFHSKGDWVVRLASFIPFHPWGRMGSHGPKNPDAHTYSYDYSDTIDGHSEWFQGDYNPVLFTQAVNKIVQTRREW